MLKKAIIILNFFILVSCSLGPNYKQPEIYSPKDLQSSINSLDGQSALPPNDWYKSLQDETLNYLINTALESAPDLAIAQEKLKQSRINLGLAKAEFGPEINAQGTYSKTKSFETAKDKNKISYYQTGFDAAWELDIWGGTRRLNESYQALLESSIANLENIKITLIAEIAANYINYRKSEKLIHITEQNLELQQDILDIVNQKYSAGLADDLALKQAQSALLTTKMQLPPLRSSLVAYKNAIATLTGILPHELDFKESNILNQKPSITPPDLHQIPANIIRYRPDVQAAEQNLIAQNALIGNKIANMFPQLSLSAFLGWQNHTLSPIFTPNYQIYNMGSTLNLPLWNWNKLLNQVKLQESITQQAVIAYQSSILSAINDINKATSNLEEEIVRNAAASQNQDAQTQILELSLTKYDNGLIDFSDVLTAEKNQLSAQQEYIQSLCNWYLDIISFNKALGATYPSTHNSVVDQKDAKGSAFEPCKD